MPNGPRPTLLWLAAGALLLAGARRVVAAPYPAGSCVARKLEAAAGACRGTFLARARFERSLRFAAFDASRTRVAHGLASRWGLAEASAAKKGTDCAEASGTAAETFAILDSAAGAFFGQVGGRNSEACIGAALRAAGTACRKALEAEGRNVAFPKRDPQRRRLATTRDHVRARLLDALPAGCYPGFEAALADAAEAIIDQIAVRLQTAPHVPSTWAMYSPPSDVEYNGQTLHPICARGTPYSFWARRGTVNKLVVNPEEVFVTGSSAGAYGTIAGAAYLLRNVYTASRFNVVGDAGAGVVTQAFVSTQLLGWGIEKNLPRWIPALDVTDLAKLNIADLWAAVANFYPRHKFGQYTTAFDGGLGGQTFFYNVMVQGDDVARWLQWWLSTCDWHTQMRAIVQDTAARAPNFRYYIGAGSRHTIWGRDQICTEAKGGVIPFARWVEQMRMDDPAWSNQECTDCSLNPGDPAPSPPVPPFNADGTVSCP